jgi:DNA (cytosine-5)-methyltransferase 1
MLSPRELFNAQGFPPDYIIDIGADGEPISKSAQVARCGNGVPPAFSEALVRANLPELCGRKIQTMDELKLEMAV